MPVTIEELRGEVEALSASLPEMADLYGLSTYKTPGKVYLLRESLCWRMEEVSRSALDALDRGDIVASAIMTRAAMETAAAVFYVHKLADDALTKGVDDKLDETLTGFLTGSKIWPENQGAIQVLRMIDAVGKKLDGFRKHYEMLSEFAHPNWSGAFGAYGKTDHEKAIATFGKGKLPSNHKLVLGMLSGSVGLFRGYYNALGDKLLPFAKLIEAHYDAQKAVTGEGGAQAEKI